MSIFFFGIFKKKQKKQDISKESLLWHERGTELERAIKQWELCRVRLTYTEDQLKKCQERCRRLITALRLYKRNSTCY